MQKDLVRLGVAVFFLFNRNTLNNRSNFLSVSKMTATVYEREICRRRNRETRVESR